ncbi:hypothetical protein D5086_029678 [Populus alba]|uniref:Uncharacterized protein n=1 Tax=Populus alba TaxID=43335 RepID=A0ACC4AU69_POPAL
MLSIISHSKSFLVHQDCYGRIAFGEQNREDASWSKLGKLVSIVTAGGGLLNQLQKESSLPKEQEIIMEQEGTYRCL